MLENFTFIIVVVSVLWIGIYLFYLYTSRQQQNISEELGSLQEQLDADETAE